MPRRALLLRLLSPVRLSEQPYQVSSHLWRNASIGVLCSRLLSPARTSSEFGILTLRAMRLSFGPFSKDSQHWRLPQLQRVGSLSGKYYITSKRFDRHSVNVVSRFFSYFACFVDSSLRADTILQCGAS